MSIVWLKDRAAALVVAHPGHELRVYQWLRLSRPLCFVLSDGSGHSGKSRVDSTTKILQESGARNGSIYGRLTDRTIYSAIIKGEFNLFIDLTGELARELVREGIEYVVGDAVEGYNPAHDVCRLMIDAAVEIASRQTDRPILNFEVFLTSQSDGHPEEAEGNMWLHLDEASLSKKLEAARVYDAIAADVNRILKQEGMKSVQTECLHPARNRSAFGSLETPYYEQHGEKQVAAGHYERVLRHHEHMVPLAEALQRYSKNGSR